MVAGPIELHCLAADQQELRIGCSVTDRHSQGGECLAQIVAGGLIRLFRPEQPGQHVAALRAVSLDRQVGQQRPHLVVGQSADRLPVQRDLERAE